MDSIPPTGSPPISPSDPSPRCGYIALIGRPNAGKSTLFNTCVGQSLSIVTAKPQTTRGRVLGILSRPGAQMIFLDTPGLLEPLYRLHRLMARQIELAVRDADAVLLLIDATSPRDRWELVRDFVAHNHKPLVAALNKVDLLPPQGLRDLAPALARELGLEQFLPVSALRGDHLPALLDQLAALLPPGPFLYPEEMVAEQPERFFAAEFIRQAAFEQLSDELPYAINVVIEEFAERLPKTFVGATVYVERESQKGILIGKGGARLRSIGKEARRLLEGFLEQQVYLELWVKVRPDWRDREEDLEEFGYG
ncbi:MAG: GTPase Era [Candidatus Handelsmanbacteria bacterium]|nr:GTPase Era [Candidatus Handelsmanbacteria bacterium]